MSQKTKRTQKIACYASTGEDRGEKTYWNWVGVVPHSKNGCGLQICLSALPIDGALTFLPPEEKPASAPDDHD